MKPNKAQSDDSSLGNSVEQIDNEESAVDLAIGASYKSMMK